MGHILLITGACRSGKSSFALSWAEEHANKRLFIATATAEDLEMEQRISRHQAERKSRGWDNIDIPHHLSGAIDQANQRNYQVILIDCLTLWTSNCFFRDNPDVQNTLRYPRDYQQLAIDEISTILQTAKDGAATVVLVTNEVGWGIVPENAMARHFRDVAGRVNQTAAKMADEVILMVCGLPVWVKGNANSGVTNV